MSHLKDCMKACCCKKEESICDIIDDLGKVVNNIDCAKKVIKEIEKVKKEISKETDKKIDKAKEELKEETGDEISDVKKELLKLIKQVNKDKWVVGEYKWMPVGSKMPKGWVKIDIGAGQTLVQGNAEGTTLGKIQVHQHFHDPMWDNKGSWVVRNFGYENAGGSSSRLTNTVATTDDGGVAFQTADHGNNLDANQKANLAAGKYAELWQFQGVDYDAEEKKDAVKKCLEGSLGETISKCLEKLNDEE